MVPARGIARIAGWFRRALVPLWQNIASLPLVGMVTLVFILVTLVAHHPLPGRVPGALAAVGALGSILYWAFVEFGRCT